MQVYEEDKSDAMPLPPANDRAVQPNGRSEASLAVRIVLAVLVWLPQPIIFFMVALGAWETTFFYGFLGSAVFLLVPAILGIVTALIFVVGKNRKATAVLAVILAALLALFAANWLDSSAKFVDPATYDRQAADALDENNIANNIEGGYGQYRPFTGEGVERLDEPATLRFSAGDNLPRVDAATALLPLASAFVTATYPEEATSVQWDRWDYNNAAENGYVAGFRLALLQAVGENESSDTRVQKIMQDSKGYTGLSREGFDLGFDRGSADGARAAAAGVQPYSVEGDNQGYYDYFDDTRIPIYDIEHPGKAFGEYGDTFQYNNSSAGFTVLAEGHTDVFFGTKADDGQAQEARGMGVEFDYTPIGREGFVFFGERLQSGGFAFRRAGEGDLRRRDNELARGRRQRRADSRIPAQPELRIPVDDGALHGRYPAHGSPQRALQRVYGRAREGRGQLRQRCGRDRILLQVLCDRPGGRIRREVARD